MRTLRLLILSLSVAGLAGCDTGLPTPPAAPPQAAPGPSKQPEMVREKAAVGMGEKGRGYGDGIVSTPIKTLWSIKEQLVLDQIQHALQIYKAMDANGRGPKSHDEFMEQIIKANGIRLPDLPPGERYEFDPIKGELMVVKPSGS